MPDFPGAEHVTVGSTSRDGRYSIVSATTATSPTKTFVYDWNTKALVQWVVPSSPEIDTTRFVSAKIETYPARDGTQIPVLVRKPEQLRSRALPGARALSRRARGRSRGRDSTPARRSWSTPDSSCSSRTCAAATATEKRGCMPMTAPSGSKS